MIERLLNCAIVGALAIGISLGAQAATPDSFPDRRVTVVLPYPGGGIVDIVTRIVMDKLGDIWNQTITVEPKPGANGNIAWDQVSRAEPDGYTWTFFSPGTIANPRMQPGLRWNEKNFTVVGAAVWAPSVVVVHPSVPAKNMAELVDYALKNPGLLNWANPGIGTSQHLNTAILLSATKLQMVEVAYKGQPPGITDLIADRVQMGVISIGLVTEHIKAGTLKPLAVLGKTRSLLLPDVPTMAEAGYPDVNVVAWYGYAVPKDTPQLIVDKIASGIASALVDPKVRASMELQGLQVVDPMSRAELQALVASDIDKYARVIAEAAIKIGN